MVQEEAFDTWYAVARNNTITVAFEKDATHPEARKGYLGQITIYGPW